MADQPPPRRRFQFSLAGLFAVTTVSAIMVHTSLNCVWLFYIVITAGMIWLIVQIAGMIPCKSPQFNQPAAKRELLPLGPPWRRVVSSVLLYSGIGYLCCVTTAAVGTGLYGYLFWGQPWLTPFLYLAIGAIWYGLRLRRRPPPATQT